MPEPMHLERLSRQDTEILELEHGQIAGHTLKLLVVERPPKVAALTLPRLRARIAERIPYARRARQRLQPIPLGLAAPVWVDDAAFSVDAHVRRAPTKGPVSEARLRELLADTMSGRLPRDRPLWDLQLVSPLPNRRTALILRFHHAWADGATVMRMLHTLLYDGGTEDEPQPNGWDPEPVPGSPELVVRALADRVGGAAGAAGALVRTATSPARWRLGLEELARMPGAVGRELLPGDGESPFAGAVGRKRSVAFTGAPLADFKAVEHAAGQHVTVNDVVLAVVAGGLRSWLGHQAGDINLRCKVPVSLHRSDEGADVGNRDSFMIVELPVGEPDPWARVHAIHRQTAERKRHHDAETLDALFSDLAMFAPPLERLLTRLTSSAREFAVNVSNVPGPREPVSILGARLAEMASLSEVGLDHALRVTAVSLCGELTIGLCADPDVVKDLDDLADEIGAALAELRADAG
jgi:diacylglycerol O-acyltransferase / wax synthase